MKGAVCVCVRARLNRAFQPFFRKLPVFGGERASARAPLCTAACSARWRGVLKLDGATTKISRGYGELFGLSCGARAFGIFSHGYTRVLGGKTESGAEASRSVLARLISFSASL